ncbi:hypothetical protein LMG28614_04730 [Paraburkholderia ultramafica]|uniref:Uncharacterized protein n=1 Tax=Paraburkholderia ultramafica TaxID=1544867 RepID=A0A6S7BFE4_9BURK|nr:hypothetical protein LMG28614_04730 [Paraburkholderia ultramafica]
MLIAPRMRGRPGCNLTAPNLRYDLMLNSFDTQWPMVYVE